MKEKRSKKESIKEEAKEEGRNVTAFAPNSDAAPPREDLKIDWPSFINFFNATMRRYGSSIATIEFLSKGKMSRVQAIVNHYGTKQVLVAAIERMARSDFLNGRIKGAGSNRTFMASFIWLTESDDHFEKVLNGYYDNPPVAELTPEDKRQLEQEAYRAQQEARRAEARRIEEEEREKQRARRQREYEEWLRQRPSAAELKKILGENYLLDK